MMTDDQIREMLSFDAFSQAEKLTGKSYKDDALTSEVGMMLSFERSSQVHSALKSMGDTPFSCRFDEYLRIAKDEGFVEVLNVPFIGHDDRNEAMIIMWHPMGILLKTDSYGEYRNTADVYFNWQAHRSFGHYGISGTHSPDDGFLGEKLDVREGLRYKMRMIKRDGVMLNPWKVKPFMWLLTYMEDRAESRDYEAINAARIALMSEDVRNAINGAAS